MSLFRDEVFRHKNDRLHGTISLALPLSWQAFSAAMACIIAVSGAFLVSASYSRSEIAAGSVVPEGGIIYIKPSRAGRIERVVVHEGQYIPKGGLLAQVRAEEVDRAGSGTQTALLAAMDAEDRGLQRQQALGDSASGSEQAQFEVQMAGLRTEAANLDAQIDVQEQLVQMAQTDLAHAADIAKGGFISRRDISSREELLLSRRQQLEVLRQGRSVKVASIEQVERARRQAASRSRAAVAALGVNRAQVERARASARQDQGFALLAPVDGYVTALSIHEGDAISPQDQAMMVIPRGGTLIASMYVPGKAIAFVRKGQEVRLAVDAYPSDRFGTLAGRITSVSSAPVLRQNASGGVAPFYAVRATILSPHFEAYGKRHHLLAGMTISARIITEKRSLFQWLFDPLLAAVKQ